MRLSHVFLARQQPDHVRGEAASATAREEHRAWLLVARRLASLLHLRRSGGAREDTVPTVQQLPQLPAGHRRRVVIQMQQRIEHLKGATRGG